MMGAPSSAVRVSAFPVHDEAARARAVEVIDALWDAPAGSPQADVRDVLATLVDCYERSRSTLPPADPRALVAYKLRELGWTQRELGRRLGWSSGRVSEVLSGRRGLTLRMVQDLTAVLGLPAGRLVHDVRNDDVEEVWVRVPSRLIAELQRSNPGDRTVDALVSRLLERAARAGGDRLGLAGGAREP